MRIVSLALLFMGCAHPGGDPAKPGGGGPLLGEYVSELRKNADRVGVIPKDLGGSAADVKAKDPSLAKPSNFVAGSSLADLEYPGATPDGFCLMERDHKAGDDTTPTDQLVKEPQDELTAEGLWVEAVDSLDQVAGQPPWPPAPSGVRLTTVKVLGDEKVTITGKKHLGNGEYVETKKDERIISLGICGPKLTTSASSRFVIAVAHGDPTTTVKLQLEEGDTENSDRKHQIRLQSDGIYVWALSDDGKYDLTK